MTVRLVSILGRGRIPAPHYDSVRYGTNGRYSTATRFVQAALVELESVTSMALFGTTEVKEQWIDSGIAAGEIGHSFGFTVIDEGNSEQERWNIFQKLSDALSPNPLEEIGEISPPKGIILDVTHGYRIQPMLAVAALNFARAEARRVGAKYPHVQISYGKFVDPNTDGEIWDLTEVFLASDWSHAIDGLMRYGRADDFAALCNEESAGAIELAKGAGAQGGALAPDNHLKEIGNKARAFADDLSTGRTFDILATSSVKLASALGSPHVATWVDRRPFLKGPIQELREWVGRLQAPSPLSPEGLVAIGHLAGIYSKTQRFLELAATMREALISEWTLRMKQTSASDAIEFREYLQGPRKDDAEAWKNAGRDFNDESSKRDPNVALSRSIVETRNDLEHVGYNASASSSTALRKKLGQLLEEFRKLAERYA